MRRGAVAVLVRVPATLGDPVGVLARSAAMVIRVTVGVTVLVVVGGRVLFVQVTTSGVMRVTVLVVVRGVSVARPVMLPGPVMVMAVAVSDDVMVVMVV